MTRLSEPQPRYREGVNDRFIHSPHEQTDQCKKKSKRTMLK
ncbi:hypothetical protein GDO81_006560 [Engystomops pustulosus]|uniref:Uncharacterized protein n=1 Tax=Engystomops pustulosus TaxID=76066 RepID=A0AAV7CY69_ENGPU|nr:hypothetical protein GDO81_006560 [Engystomops pustulosus]